MTKKAQEEKIKVMPQHRKARKMGYRDRLKHKKLIINNKINETKNKQTKIIKLQIIIRKNINERSNKST